MSLRDDLKAIQDARTADFAVLDAIGVEIKEVEAALEAAGLREEIEVPIGDGENLVWARGNGRRWRLMYDDPDHDCFRPLIETPQAVRARMRDPLREFVAAVRRRVTEGRR